MWNAKSMLTYEKTIKDVHKIHAIVGREDYKYNQKDAGAEPVSSGVGFSSSYYRQPTQMDWAPSYPPTQKGAGSPVVGFVSRDFYSFSSLFTRINYKYKDKYIVELNLRRDGSSRFGPNKRFGYFPGGAVSWILSEEEYFKSIDFLTFLKLRFSYGVNGSANIGNFSWYEGIRRPTNAYQNLNGIEYSRLANPDLTWERSKQANLGINFGFFGGRLSGSVDVYRKTTDKLILPLPVQVSATGFGEIVMNTDLVMNNTGIEFSLSSKNLIGDFKWDTDFNITSNRNRVVDVAGIRPDAINGGPGDSRILEGYSVGTSYIAKYAGVDPATGTELIYALNGEKVPLTSASQRDNRQPFGNPFPKFVGGINNRFSFKGFDLSVLFAYSYGNTIYDDGAKFQIGGRLGEWNQRVELLDRWQKPGDQTNVPRVSITAGGGNTTRWLEDGSFLRLRNLQLGYTLPSSITQRAKVSTMRVFVAAQNLWVLTNYSGWDPEVVRYINNDAPGAVQGNVSFSAPYLPAPQAKTFTFGVNVTL
jgi:TonB-linked SusC/RagA family outer membrane protein